MHQRKENRLSIEKVEDSVRMSERLRDQDREDGRFDGLQFNGGQTRRECLPTVTEESFEVAEMWEKRGWWIVYKSADRAKTFACSILGIQQTSTVFCCVGR